METTIAYWCYIKILEKKTETTNSMSVLNKAAGKEHGNYNSARIPTVSVNRAMQDFVHQQHVLDVVHCP